MGFQLNIRTISLRPITEDDMDSLYDIYCSTKKLELDLMAGCSEPEKENFLKQQFSAQHYYYLSNYNPAYFGILESNSTVIGRLYIHEIAEELCIVDITLLPPFRNKGIGSQVLENILQYATNEGKKVILHVENTNPAIYLYRKLGFQVLNDNGVYSLLIWKKENNFIKK